MNGVAHYSTSLIITIFIYHYLKDGKFDFLDKRLGKFTLLQIFRITLIFTFNFFFHIFVDIWANITYHPSQSHWSDIFYASWHIFTYIAEAVFAIYILKKDLRYIFGMIGSVGFDLWEWSIVRPLHKIYGVNLPGVHWMIQPVENLLFWWLPKLTYIKALAIIEIIFVTIMITIWMKMEKSWPLPNNYPGSKYHIILILIFFGSLRLLTLY